MADAGIAALLVRTLVSLGIVLVLVAIAYAVAKRRAPGAPRPARPAGRGRARSAATPIDVVGRAGLTRGAVAVAVRFGDRIVLVATGEHGPASVLAEMPATEWDDAQIVRERIVPSPAAGSVPAPTRPSFVDALREATARRA